jgi:serine/threonine protein phosphatase PrpC
MTTIGLTAFTDTGLVRDHNEDALLVGSWMCQSAVGDLVTMQFDVDASLVCAVADGMGGHAGGELASRVALGVLADAAPHWRDSTDVETTLVETNDRVRQVGANPDLRGLGTTIAGVCILSDSVIAFNVGDSRVYSINSGFLQQISVDDSVLDANGRPTSTITQSLGQTQPVSPHVQVLPRDGATYLICSDGVSGGMSAAALRAAALKPTLHECVSSIVDGTRANGAEDNFSVILVEVPPIRDAGGPDATRPDRHSPPATTYDAAAAPPPTTSANPSLQGGIQ